MKQEVPILLSNKVKEKRIEKNLTQQQLADLVQVSSRTIISLEKGQYNPSVLLAHKLATIFGLAIEQVFDFEEDPYAKK